MCSNEDPTQPKIKKKKTREEYIFFSHAHETFTNIDHILDHKTNLNKRIRVIIQNINMSPTVIQLIRNQ